MLIGIFFFVGVWRDFVFEGGFGEGRSDSKVFMVVIIFRKEGVASKIKGLPLVVGHSNKKYRYDSKYILHLLKPWMKISKSSNYTNQKKLSRNLTYSLKWSCLICDLLILTMCSSSYSTANSLSPPTFLSKKYIFLTVLLFYFRRLLPCRGSFWRIRTFTSNYFIFFPHISASSHFHFSSSFLSYLFPSGSDFLPFDWSARFYFVILLFYIASGSSSLLTLLVLLRPFPSIWIFSFWTVSEWLFFIDTCQYKKYNHFWFIDFKLSSDNILYQ